MTKKSMFYGVLLCGALCVQAVDFSLSGTVKDPKGNPIPGAVVNTYLLDTLAVQYNALADEYIQDFPRAETDSQGVFHLSGQLVATLQSEVSSVPQRQFTIKNGAIVFSPALRSISGCVAVYSANGKQIASMPFNDIKSGKSIRLPRLSAGLNILRLSIGKESYIRSLFCLGDAIYFGNGSNNIRTHGNSKMAKQTAIEDTLVAGKKEFITACVPINSLTQQDIEVTLDTGVCRSLFQISDSMIPNWKMGASTVDSSFSLWSSSDLWMNIDGGYDEYTRRGMLQAADLWMKGERDSSDTGEVVLVVHTLAKHSFIMDFGTDENAATMYQNKKSQYYKPNKVADLPGYDTSVAFASKASGGYTLYAHYKKFYFELVVIGYSNKELALSEAKMFFELFKGKIN